jgi:hypothetical protein
MLETHWFALVAVAGILTLAWLFVEERLFVTTGLSTALYAIAFFAAPGVEKLLRDGTRVPIGDDLLMWQWITLAFGLLSALAFFGYYWGVYPPETDSVEDADALAR